MVRPMWQSSRFFAKSAHSQKAILTIFTNEVSAALCWCTRLAPAPTTQPTTSTSTVYVHV
jgi:hypothetical protein